MVIVVPAVPWLGEMVVTEPIVHGVNKKFNRFVEGTVCRQELGFRMALELHDEAGIDPTVSNNVCEF